MNQTPSLQSINKSAFWQRVFRTHAEDHVPHTISHQRIYIVPSKRGFAFLASILLMLVASINYSLSLGYALCFLLTGLFSATLLHTYRNLAGITINAIVARDAFATEAARFDITLSNPYARPRHGVNVRTGTSTQTTVRLEANDAAQAQIEVNNTTRGVCKLGRLTLQSDWPLGLWTCWSYLHVDRQALVFPQPEAKPPSLPSVRGDEDGLLSDRALQGDVSGLRDYQPGDSIGSIAWKSAARGFALQSRTFDSQASHSQTIIDLKLATVPGLEAQLSRLCAWVLAADSSNTDYAFRLPPCSLDKGKGREHREQALQALALYGISSQKAA